MRKILLICSILLIFLACKKDNAAKKETTNTGESISNSVSQSNRHYESTDESEEDSSKRYDDSWDEDYEVCFPEDFDFWSEIEKVWFLITHLGANLKYNLKPLFLEEINFGLPGGKNWFVLKPDINGKIDDRLNMSVHVFDDSREEINWYHIMSTNPALINRTDILCEVPGVRFDNIQNFVINDFNKDGYDEILSYVIIPSGENHNYIYIDKYNDEKKRQINKVLKVEFDLTEDKNFIPIEYKEIDGRSGFRIYSVLDDGTSKWMFYTWDDRTKRYEEISDIVNNRIVTAVIKPLPSWNIVSDNPFSSPIIYEIKYINDRFAAIGTKGEIAYSKDGKTWNMEKIDLFSSFRVVTIGYGNNLFVAGGEGVIAYSKDCVTWTAVSDSTFGEERIRDIEYLNNIFFAAGDKGKIAYSKDGMTWTAVKDSTFGENTINRIAYGNNMFVAVSNKSNIAYSKDGITWTAVNNTYRIFGIYNYIFNIVYAKGLFIAVGGGGAIGYSKDGIIWSAVRDSTFAANHNILSVAYGNDRFVATDNNGKIAYSADGINWTAIKDDPFGDSYIRGVAYGNKRFVAVSDSGKIAWCAW